MADEPRPDVMAGDPTSASLLLTSRLERLKQGPQLQRSRISMEPQEPANRFLRSTTIIRGSAQETSPASSLLGSRLHRDGGMDGMRGSFRDRRSLAPEENRRNPFADVVRRTDFWSSLPSATHSHATSVSQDSGLKHMQRSFEPALPTFEEVRPSNALAKVRDLLKQKGVTAPGINDIVPSPTSPAPMGRFETIMQRRKTNGSISSRSSVCSDLEDKENDFNDGPLSKVNTYSDYSKVNGQVNGATEPSNGLLYSEEHYPSPNKRQRDEEDRETVFSFRRNLDEESFALPLSPVSTTSSGGMFSGSEDFPVNRISSKFQAHRDNVDSATSGAEERLRRAAKILEESRRNYLQNGSVKESQGKYNLSDNETETVYPSVNKSQEFNIRIDPKERGHDNNAYRKESSVPSSKQQNVPKKKVDDTHPRKEMVTNTEKPKHSSAKVIDEGKAVKKSSVDKVSKKTPPSSRKEADQKAETKSTRGNKPKKLPQIAMFENLGKQNKSADDKPAKRGIRGKNVDSSRNKVVQKMLFGKSPEPRDEATETFDGKGDDSKTSELAEAMRMANLNRPEEFFVPEGGIQPNTTEEFDRSSQVRKASPSSSGKASPVSRTGRMSPHSRKTDRSEKTGRTSPSEKSGTTSPHSRSSRSSPSSKANQSGARARGKSSDRNSSRSRRNSLERGSPSSRRNSVSSTIESAPYGRKSGTRVEDRQTLSSLNKMSDRARSRSKPDLLDDSNNGRTNDEKPPLPSPVGKPKLQRSKSVGKAEYNPSDQKDKPDPKTYLRKASVGAVNVSPRGKQKGRESPQGSKIRKDANSPSSSSQNTQKSRQELHGRQGVRAQQKESTPKSSDLVSYTDTMDINNSNASTPVQIDQVGGPRKPVGGWEFIYVGPKERKSDEVKRLIDKSREQRGVELTPEDPDVVPVGPGVIRDVLNQFKPRGALNQDTASQKGQPETVNQNNGSQNNLPQSTSPVVRKPSRSPEMISNQISSTHEINDSGANNGSSSKTADILGRLAQIRQSQAASVAPERMTNGSGSKDFTPRTADLFEKLAQMRQSLKSANRPFDIVPERPQWQSSDSSPAYQYNDGQSHIDRLIPEEDERDHFEEGEVSEMGGAPIYNLASLRLDLQDLKDNSSDREVEEVFATARSVDSEYSESIDYESATEGFIEAPSPPNLAEEEDSSSEYNSAAETLDSDSSDELMERERIDSVIESPLKMSRNARPSGLHPQENPQKQMTVEVENANLTISHARDGPSPMLLDSDEDLNEDHYSELSDRVLPEKELMIQVEVEVVHDPATVQDEEQVDLIAFDEDDVLTPTGTEAVTPLARQISESGKDVDALLFDYNFVPIDVPTVFDSLPSEMEAASLPSETAVGTLPSETEEDALPSETEKSTLLSETEVTTLPSEVEVHVVTLPSETEVGTLTSEALKATLPSETVVTSLPSEIEVHVATLPGGTEEGRLSSETEVTTWASEMGVHVATLPNETEVGIFPSETEVGTLTSETLEATLPSEMRVVALPSETELAVLQNDREVGTLASPTEVPALLSETEKVASQSESKKATLPREAKALPSEIEVARGTGVKAISSELEITAVPRGTLPSEVGITYAPDDPETINPQLSTCLEASPILKCDPFEAIISGLSKVAGTPPVSENSESETEVTEAEPPILQRLKGENEMPKLKISQVEVDHTPDITSPQVCEENGYETRAVTYDDGHRFDPSEENWVSLDHKLVECEIVESNAEGGIDVVFNETVQVCDQMSPPEETTMTTEEKGASKESETSRTYASALLGTDDFKQSGTVSTESKSREKDLHSCVASQESVSAFQPSLGVYNNTEQATNVVKVQIREGKLDKTEIEGGNSPTHAHQNDPRYGDAEVDPTCTLKDQILEAIESIDVETSEDWDHSVSNNTKTSIPSRQKPEISSESWPVVIWQLRSAAEGDERSPGVNIKHNNSKVSLTSLNSESSLQSAGTDGLEETSGTASSEQKTQDSDMPEVFESKTSPEVSSLVAAGQSEQQNASGKKKRNRSGSEKRRKRKKSQRTAINLPEATSSSQAPGPSGDQTPEQHKPKKRSGKKSNGAILVTNLLVLDMGLSGCTSELHEGEPGAVFLPLRNDLASEENWNTGSAADDESDGKEIMIDTSLINENNNAHEVLQLPVCTDSSQPLSPKEELPEPGFIKKNIFVQRDGDSKLGENELVPLADSQVTICAVLKRTLGALTSKRRKESVEDQILEAIESIDVETPSDDWDFIEIPEQNLSAQTESCIETPEQSPSAETESCIETSEPSLSAETESECKPLPPKLVRDHRYSFVYRNKFVQEDLKSKPDQGDSSQENRIVGRRRHNSLGPVTRKARHRCLSPEIPPATGNSGESLDRVDHCGHDTTDSEEFLSCGSSVCDSVGTPELLADVHSGSKPKKGKHKLHFVRDNVFFRSDTKLKFKKRLDTSTSSDESFASCEGHPESNVDNTGHKHEAKHHKGEGSSIRKSIRAGLKRLTHSKSFRWSKTKAASSTCDLRESDHVDRVLESQTGSMLNSLGNSTPCLLESCTSTGASGAVSTGPSQSGPTAVGAANGGEPDSDLGHDGTEVVKSRIHLKTWDPSKLLQALYSVRLMDETVEDLSHHFISMEGVMEKLPMGKKKSTLLKTWKRRYFKACDGWLHYYENNNYEKPSHSIQLMGGSIEVLDSRIIGIDDGRGHYLMVRCPSGPDFENWRVSLESQTTDNVKAVYVRPVQNSPPHPKKKVVIIDVGSTSMRAGILGEDPSLPQVFFPMVAAKNKSTGSHVIGCDAYKPDVRENSTLYFPIRPSNKVDKFNIDMDLMPLFFEKVFRDLKIDCRSHWVLLSTPQMLADKLKAEFMDLLINRFSVAGVCMAPQSLLAIYSYKATSGIIVDVGERIEILPISDGYIVEKGVTRQPFGGEKVADSLNHSLTELRYRFFTEVENLIVRYVMEQTCYVAHSYAEEIKKFEEDPQSVQSTVFLTNLDLPEGTYSEVTHDYSCFKSAEGFFNTDVWGMDYPNLHKLVHKAILECPMDNRREMCRSIYLSGGVTMLPGFADRLQTEITKLVPAGLTIQVHASPQRYHAAFIGGCTLASQDVFEQSCISREQWKKNGSKELKRWHMPS